jgi:hypothetical protein
MPTIATLVITGLVAASLAGQRAPTPTSTASELYLASDVPARQLGIRIGVDRASSTPGGALALVVAVTPRARMHVYAPGEPDYIPIDLTIEPSEFYTAGKPAYPTGRQMFLEAVSARVRVYDGPFRITQPVTLARTEAVSSLARSARAVSVKGTLRYQACDDSVCYRPETVSLEWRIPVRR